jgi:hypothetical protein
MSGKSAAAAPEDKGPGHIEDADAVPKKKRGKLPIIIAAVVVLLLGAVGYLAYAGKLPFLRHHAKAKQTVAAQVQFIKVPELISTPGRRAIPTPRCRPSWK